MMLELGNDKAGYGQSLLLALIPLWASIFR